MPATPARAAHHAARATRHVNDSETFCEIRSHMVNVPTSLFRITFQEQYTTIGASFDHSTRVADVTYLFAESLPLLLLSGVGFFVFRTVMRGSPLPPAPLSHSGRGGVSVWRPGEVATRPRQDARFLPPPLRGEGGQRRYVAPQSRGAKLEDMPRHIPQHELPGSGEEGAKCLYCSL